MQSQRSGNFNLEYAEYDIKVRSINESLVSNNREFDSLIFVDTLKAKDSNPQDLTQDNIRIKFKNAQIGTYSRQVVLEKSEYIQKFIQNKINPKLVQEVTVSVDFDQESFMGDKEEHAQLTKELDEGEGKQKIEKIENIENTQNAVDNSNKNLPKPSVESQGVDRDVKAESKDPLTSS